MYRIKVSASVFKIKYTVFWDILILHILFLIIKINNFRGVRTGFMTKTEALIKVSHRYYTLLWKHIHWSSLQAGAASATSPYIGDTNNSTLLENYYASDSIITRNTIPGMEKLDKLYTVNPGYNETLDTTNLCDGHHPDECKWNHILHNKSLYIANHLQGFKRVRCIQGSLYISVIQDSVINWEAHHRNWRLWT